MTIEIIVLTKQELEKLVLDIMDKACVTDNKPVITTIEAAKLMGCSYNTLSKKYGEAKMHQNGWNRKRLMHFLDVAAIL